MGYFFHEVPCVCQEPVGGKFIVFSEVQTEDGMLIEKFAQCPHCHRIHKIIEAHESEIVESGSFKTIGSFKFEFSDGLKKVLNDFRCKVHIYEAICYLKKRGLSANVILEKTFDVDNDKWEYVFMSIDENGDYEVFKSEANSTLNG